MSYPETIQNLERAVIDGDTDRAQKFAQQILKEKIDIQMAIDDGLIKGIKQVGDAGAKEAISTGGGSWPRWSNKGDILFYLKGSTMMMVNVRLKPKFQVIGSPKNLFEGRYAEWYDVTPDDQKFVMITREQAVLTNINVILNWAEEIKKKVPLTAEEKK